YRETDYLLTVRQNDVADLEAVFEDAERENVFIEAFFMEPVMGEGNPGEAVTPEFYRRARELTEQHGTLLLVDSIQAGLRAHGVLSIVDYPGFRDLPPPDMETYSKALNAGQYPLSVLALKGRAAELYRYGVYGNTMTSNPRAMDAAVAVLDPHTPEVRANIRQRGLRLREKLERLPAELGDAITRVQGTGLLLSCELHPRYKCYGADSVEDWLRRHGLGVIHGGVNSLRYTPWFHMNEAEVDLVVELTRRALVQTPTAGRAPAGPRPSPVGVRGRARGPFGIRARGAASLTSRSRSRPEPDDERQQGEPVPARGMLRDGVYVGGLRRRGGYGRTLGREQSAGRLAAHHHRHHERHVDEPRREPRRPDDR